MRLDDERLSYKELTNFLNKHGFGDREFANLLGVTIQAVRLWKSGEREFSTTNSRLIKMFIKYPTLVREFGRI